METSAFVILIAAVFTNNILLANFLGMCPFIGCSNQIGTAIGLGTAVTFVNTLTCIINYCVYKFVLERFGLEHLQFIVFIAVIAAFVQFVEMFVERFSPKLYFALGIFLPLITVNCAILGSSIFLVLRDYTFPQSVAFGLGGGLRLCRLDGHLGDVGLVQQEVEHLLIAEGQVDDAQGAVGVEFLVEVALGVEQADADQGHTQVRARLEVVAREDAEAARVNRQGVMNGKFK